MRVSDGRSCGEAERDGSAVPLGIPRKAPGIEPDAAPGMAGIAFSDIGSAVKNSFAMRAIVSVSGQPAGTSKLVAGRVVARSEPCFSGAPFCGSLVVMVAADFNVFERSDGVVYEDGC